VFPDALRRGALRDASLLEGRRGGLAVAVQGGLRAVPRRAGGGAVDVRAVHHDVGVHVVVEDVRRRAEDEGGREGAAEPEP
jgi:hypothetical protein